MGMSMLSQMMVYAFLFWVGGYLSRKYPKTVTNEGMNRAIFVLLFALGSLGIAFQDVTDRKEVDKGASRIFYLLDRKSEIDPLSDEGATVEYRAQLESKKKKKSGKKKNRDSSLNDVTEEEAEIIVVDESDVVENTGIEKRKSSKKKKKSKKEDSLPEVESEDILFAPESDTQEDDDHEEDIKARIAVLEEKSKNVEPPKPTDTDQVF